MMIVPVAADSMGVRSMATLVLSDKVFFIDPSAALGPLRYGLPPSKEEEEMLALSFKRIIDVAKHTEVFFITHYHYDHHPHPSLEDVYEKLFSDKLIVSIDYRNLHASGKTRGKAFHDLASEFAKEIIFVEDSELKFGRTAIHTKTVWHGEVGSKVGKVLMLFFSHGKQTYLFGSDAQNLYDPEAREWFEEKNPEVATVDGYPTIFVGWRFSAKKFEESKKLLLETVRKTQLKTLIFEHHLLRDANYRKKISEFFEILEVKTAAEYLGAENLFLEAWRKKIHRGEIKPDVKAFDREINLRIRELIK
ncbi:MAG: MBL fold metallo-hydrolase [Candidatus Micrarchaeota archaeon]|nr:MBL fold metallo-hydrolase [Candidatus Micrarchaeota archaeon]